MSSPLLQAVNAYLKKNPSRFHMPGHKGQGIPFMGESLAFDITEVDGCDSLYDADGAILETEQRFAHLYGAGATLLSAGGSTLCIQTMLATAVPPGSIIVTARGVHTAAVSTMALLDLRPSWVYPRQDTQSGLALPVTPAEISATLEQNPEAKAVYLTSPDYFGQLADLRGISSVCTKYNVPLLVDNAHGAHLHFLPTSLHPINQGANFCCDSLHKTLPALTGAALLHCKDAELRASAKSRMALFGSTSPSYLIMLSADALLPCLEGDIPERLAHLAVRVASLRNLATSKGFALPREPLDPVRLTVGFSRAGYGKEEFADIFRQAAMEPEYLDNSFCVLLPGVDQPQEDFTRLEGFLRGFTPRKPIAPALWTLQPNAQAMPLRQATLAPWEQVCPEDAVGRIAASTVAPCPPGIPLVIPGERIGLDMADCLKFYGISRLNVVK